MGAWGRVVFWQNVHFLFYVFLDARHVSALSLRSNHAIRLESVDSRDTRVDYRTCLPYFLASRSLV